MNPPLHCRDTAFCAPAVMPSQEERLRAKSASWGERTATVLAAHKPGVDPGEPAWFEKLIPAPRKDVAGQLDPDAYLKGTWPGFPLDYARYQREVDARVLLENDGKGDDYTFEPFMALLDNMRRVSSHCLADRQFEEALTEEEYRAFLGVQGHIDQMKQLGAPYKRTVWLAVLLATVQEVVSGRHVIDGLKGQEAGKALRKKQRLRTFTFFAPDQCRLPAGSRLSWPQIDLDKVLACRWGGLNPAGSLDECQQLFIGGSFIGHHLQDWLDTPTLFLCPSFEPLDLADFCRFGPLPVYPLGLITAAAVNADGVMHTPLAFLEHDLDHVSTTRGWTCVHSDRLLESVSGRERFGRLVLERLPAEWEALQPALHLIVFYLFHEARPLGAEAVMQEEHCGRLLGRISELCRARRWDLSPLYRRITDRQAWLACHWAHALYRELDRAAGACCRPEQQGVESVSQALEQWRFFEDNRSAIHSWLMSRQKTATTWSGDVLRRIECRSEWVWWQSGSHWLTVREEYNSRCEGPVDYTDVAYKAVLLHPQLREQMLQALACCRLEGRLNGHTLTEEQTA